MKKIMLLAVFAAILFVSSAAFAADIVLLPGWRQTKEQIAVLGKRIGGEAVMIESKLPLWTAAEELKEELDKKGKIGKVILVGFSWGGLVARQFAETHPERVSAVVVIGSPNGGYRLAPAILFRIVVEKSLHIPIFVVAGEKSESKWWLREVNDGVVDLESVFDLPKPPTGGLVLNLSHDELLKSHVVADQIVYWLAKTEISRGALAAGK